MVENADLAVPRDLVREHQELMAAVGQLAVGAAALEYSVAVLVALTEGHRNQAAEDRALQLVQKDGAPVRELRKLAAGPPERGDLTWLCQKTEAVLDDRNAVVHAIPFEDSTAGAKGGLIGWHPHTGQEMQLTMSVVLRHVEGLRIVWRGVDEAITATSKAGTRRVIRRPAVSGEPALSGGPPWGPAPKPLGVP